MDRWDLIEALDLPLHLGGQSLHSLERAADSEVLGLWAAIVANLIAFIRSTNSAVYEDLAVYLEDTLSDPPEDLLEDSHTEGPAEALVGVHRRTETLLQDITEGEI